MSSGSDEADRGMSRVPPTGQFIQAEAKSACGEMPAVSAFVHDF
jgi:hypothetical protein